MKRTVCRELNENFFSRSALSVSRDLIGKVLVRNTKDGELAGVITEVEAYIGPHDKACHAYKGLTQRTAVMFGPAGYWYVYLCYGMYWMLNIVTGRKNYPCAVLIRGVVQMPDENNGISNYSHKSSVVARCIVPVKRRNMPDDTAHDSRFPIPDSRFHASINGPGRLTKSFGIDGSFNGKKADQSTGLWIEDRGVIVGPKDIVRTPRIGVTYAGEWAKKPYRFVWKDCYCCVSAK